MQFEARWSAVAMSGGTCEWLSGGQIVAWRRHGVAELVFNRPAMHNAFSPGMYDALERTFLDLSSDAGTRVLILRGAGGKAFAAGNDINNFVGMTDESEALAYEKRIGHLLQSLSELPQVTVAAIEGVCVGGGLAVANCCDLRVCTPNSSFGYPVSRTLGNALSARAVYRCVTVFGEPLTRQMLLAAGMVDPWRAHAVGAVMDVVDAGDLDRQLEGLVDGILRAAPGTLRVTKQQLRMRAESLEAAPDDDEDRLAAVYRSADFREGVKAFLAGERPDFGDTSPHRPNH